MAESVLHNISAIKEGDDSCKDTTTDPSFASGTPDRQSSHFDGDEMCIFGVRDRPIRQSNEKYQVGMFECFHENEDDNCPQNAFSVAVKANNLAAVEDLLQAGADPNALNTKGCTALQTTIEDPAIVQCLLAAGADPNAQNEWGLTPLHYAENHTVVQMLIEAGAMTDTRDIWGNTPLFCSFDSQSTRLLLAAGADPNAQNNKGETALYDRGEQECMRILLQAGADPQICTYSGRTPLHGSRIPEITQLLLAAGADPNAQDSDGDTPLRYPLTPEIAQILLAGGADPNIQNNYGMTPIHDLDATILQLLLEAGADPNIKNHQGNTALHNLLDSFQSMVNSHLEDLQPILQLLLEESRKSDIVYADGRTPLGYLFWFKQLSLLLSAGADPAIKNHKGETPFEKCDNPEIQYLVGQCRRRYVQNKGLLALSSSRSPMQKKRHQGTIKIQ